MVDRGERKEMAVLLKLPTHTIQSYRLSSSTLTSRMCRLYNYYKFGGVASLPSK